jgi:hypothetical protein
MLSQHVTDPVQIYIHEEPHCGNLAQPNFMADPHSSTEESFDSFLILRPNDKPYSKRHRYATSKSKNSFVLLSQISFS